MPKIGILDFEDKIQVSDKTRFDASKSFVTPDGLALSNVEIRPGLDGSFITVWNTNAKQRFLDWAWSSQNFDIDSTNNKIYFQVGSTEYTATLTGGSYSFSTLKTEIATALNAAFSGTYSVTSDEKNRLKISLSGQKIKIFASKGSENVMLDLGFNEDTELKNEVIGKPVEYGVKSITVRLSDAAPSSSTFTFYQKVYTKQSDALFSGDQDLIGNEYDIMKYVPQGRSSFLNVHRRAQNMILEFLDQNGYADSGGNKFDKYAIVDISEASAWSKYLALELIFREFNNAKDDVFIEKAKHYEKLALNARNRAILRLDVDGDGKADTDSSPSTWSADMVRK